MARTYILWGSIFVCVVCASPLMLTISCAYSKWQAGLAKKERSATTKRLIPLTNMLQQNT